MYHVISRWAGWFGGWGSESDIAQVLNEQAAVGWKLIRTETWLCFWWFFLPRKKLLLIFEQAAKPS